MNNTLQLHLPKLQQFIQNFTEDNSSVDLSKLQNTLELRIQQTIITVNEVLHFYEYCQSQEFLKMHSSRNWTDEEWKILLWVTLQYCSLNLKSSDEIQGQDWNNISEIIAFKDSLNCQFKWFSHLRIIPSNKNWLPEEDKLLYKIMTKEPNIKWFEVQYEMFIQSQGIYFRKAKQYRERWNNYLNPQVNRGIWTELDDYNLLQITLVEGLRWSNISKKLKNRTENQVKNRFKSIINKEKKIVQIPSELQQDHLDDPLKHGLDKMTEFLIHSILSRLKPVDQNQNSNSNQQEHLSYNNEQSFSQIPSYPYIMGPQSYYYQQFSQIPQIPQISQISQIPQIPQIPQIQTIPIMQPQLQQSNPILPCQQQQLQGMNIQIPQHQSLISQQLIQQQLIQQQQQQMIPNFYQAQYIPQQFIQQQQQQQQQQSQFKFNVYSSQQNTPTNSIGTLSSQRSEKLISDQIKEEENSGSSSNKEPKVQKMVCVSAQSSINGSTSSVNSLDAIKHNFNNMHLDSEQNSPDPIQKRKHQRSQSGAFDVNNQGKVKTKRSRFFYASNDG
ncbi:unnamed protein product [Paramecium sonneborni]|uniref:Uncharacterized protein n=1 Tax=Paramecium sonneborni TaxID=65129 RepID=A0A8S1PNH4_9CILI|nr:unnamed protein product [Paramecium sonneborni]